MRQTKSYAAKTEIPASRTRLEIERLVESHGGEEYTISLRQDHAIVGFRLSGRAIKLTLPLPDRADPAFTHIDRWRERSETAAQERWEQACRSRWRALHLVIKAKLEAVAVGILEVDEAFFADVMTETGATVYERHRGEILPPLPAVSRLSLPERKG